MNQSGETGDRGSGIEEAENGQLPTAANSLTDPEDWSENAIHLLRTTQINTLALSQMADQKANIMIGATFVVFSLSVTRLMGETITLATLCLAATAFLSSLCAVIAVMPTFSAPPDDDARFNPLFFGHFATLREEQWQDLLIDRFHKDETVYRTMMHDIYGNGRVLHRRKYRFLSFGYRIFLGGLLLTMLVFVWEYNTDGIIAV